MGESTFIFRGIRSDFQIVFNFSMKILLANRIAPDGTPHSAASHLGLYCLPMSHKKDVRLNELSKEVWVQVCYVITQNHAQYLLASKLQKNHAHKCLNANKQIVGI